MKTVIHQLLSVVKFLHAQGICHRDIKPENVLFDRKSGRIWLIDFGVSKLMVEGGLKKLMMTNTGTTHYKAPEILEGGIYNELIDEWAVGITLFEMVERRLPFANDYLTDVIECIRNIHYEESEAWDKYSRYARDLLRRLLRPVSQRLSAEVALKAPWFLQRYSSKE